MVGLNNTHKSFILILFAAMLFVMPSAAINTAIYGDTAGFNPDLHKDTFHHCVFSPGFAGFRSRYQYHEIYRSHC